MKTIQMLQREGVTVEVSKLDVAVRQQAQQLVADCQRLAPIGGIFHLAMILEDRLILKHVSPPAYQHLPLANWKLCQLKPTFASVLGLVPPIACQLYTTAGCRMCALCATIS